MFLKKLQTKESLMGTGSLFFIIVSIAIVIGLILGIIAVSKDNDRYGSNVISVTGEGEVTAIPDIASVGFTVRAEGKDMVAAQKIVTERGDAVIKALREKGIEEKDIKTDSYTSNPKYEWKQVATCAAAYCAPGNQELVGYEVSHSMTVKIRDINAAGDIVSIIGAQKVDSMYGPNFTVDDDRDVAAEAREAAIKDAKAKAEVLASQLGVRLGKLVDFYENGNGYPVPMYKGGVAMDAMSVRNEAAMAPAPMLPVGENTVTTQVTVTYRIK